MEKGGDEKKREERGRGRKELVAATGHLCDLELTKICELQSE